jgi:hypothetical protein
MDLNCTLLCLGADSIIMTKQAVLGPIDPSVHTPLNPQIPGAAHNAKVPVSVESINGFIKGIPGTPYLIIGSVLENS